MQHTPERYAPTILPAYGTHAVKIYTPLGHGCCIPWPLAMHTRSGMTKYKFHPLLGPLFTAPDLFVPSQSYLILNLPESPFLSLDRFFPASSRSGSNCSPIDYHASLFFPPLVFHSFFPVFLCEIIGADSRTWKNEKNVITSNAKLVRRITQ